MADYLPAVESEVLALGKPQEMPPIPQGEVRGSIGKFKGKWGHALVVSNKVTRGFSGGPLLDVSGKAFGVTVSIVNHVDYTAQLWPELRLTRPSCWNEEWAVAVDLVALKDKVQAALRYR